MRVKALILCSESREWAIERRSSFASASNDTAGIANKGFCGCKY